MSKKILFGVLSVILCAVVAFVSCYFAIPDFNVWVKDKIAGKKLGGNTDDKKDNDDNNQSDNPASAGDIFDNYLFTADDSNSFMLLSATAYEVRTTNVPSYLLTATVKPAEAVNKEVDWSVMWADETNTSTVTDYVTISPTADGAQTAVVSCHAPFSGIILVKVTTRDGGINAYCSVQFKGIPSELNTSSSLLYSNGFYTVGSSGNYTVTLSLDNVFHQVGSEYGNYTVNVIKHGEIKLGGTVNNFSSGIVAYENIGGSDKYPNRVQFSALDMSYMQEAYGYSEFVEFSVSGNVLNIKSNGSVFAFESEKAFSMGSYCPRHGVYAETAETCYYEVVITDTASNLSKTLNITWGDSIAQSVEVTSSVEF